MNIKFVVLKESKPYKIFKIYRFNWRLFRRAARRHEFSFSPDCNDILLGCGRSEAEPVTQKIQWKAGKSSKKMLKRLRV